MGDNSDLEENGHGGQGVDGGYILKVEFIGFTDRMDFEYKRKRGSLQDVLTETTGKDGIAIY